jgi:hypothetical protein
MEPRVLEGLSTLAPWSMAVNTHLKKKVEIGGQGGTCPLGLPPALGREGVILSIALSALWEGFLQSHFFNNTQRTVCIFHRPGNTIQVICIIFF